MKADERKEKVYEAALKVFSKYGYKKTTVEDIAAELGLTKGALYLYAEDKSDLYKRSVKYGFLKWQNRVIEAVEKTEGTKEKLEVLCKKAFQYLSEDDVLKGILSKDPDVFPLSYEKDPFKEVNEASMKLLKEILDKGIKEKVFKEVDAEFMTRLLFTAYKNLIIETYVLSENASEMFEELFGLLAKGFYNTDK